MILMAHMARLTKAHEVFSSVGIFWAVKEPKRLDVVDRQTFPNVDPTFSAVSSLILHDASADKKPTPATVGSWPSHPIGGRRAFRLGGPAAADRAEARHAVLSGQPWLLLKVCPAMGAGESNAIAPARMCGARDVLGLKSIGRTKASPELITNQMSLWGRVQKCFCLPSRPARCTTKSRLRLPVRLHGKRSITDFAGLLNHAGSIAESGNMVNRTALIACRRVEEATRQPDMFVAPPPSSPSRRRYCDPWALDPEASS